MKCLVINLDRSPARLAHAISEFSRIGIDFDRVAAVDGLANTEIVAPSPNLSSGEIGCVLSHRACWQIIANGDDPYVGIFEDDIIFSETAGRMLVSEDWIPADADIIKLETCFNKTVVAIKRAASLVHGYALHRLHWLHCGSAGYIISKQAAIDLLKTTQNIDRAVDIVLFDPTSDPASSKTIYQLSPALCAQARFFPDKATALPSELDQNRSANFLAQAPRRKKNAWRKIAVECKRVWQELFDLLRLRRGVTVPFVYCGRRFRRPTRQWRFANGLQKQSWT